MREIKFRAWDKMDEEMMEWWRLRRIIYNSDHADVKDTDGYGKHNDIFKDPHLILMQYTGLKDKNGKEIYEGDILKFHNRLDLHEDFEGSVFWHETNACWVHTFLEGRPSKGFWGSEWDIEVIGNIYENK